MPGVEEARDAERPGGRGNRLGVPGGAGVVGDQQVGGPPAVIDGEKAGRPIAACSPAPADRPGADRPDSRPRIPIDDAGAGGGCHGLYRRGGGFALVSVTAGTSYLPGAAPDNRPGIAPGFARRSARGQGTPSFAEFSRVLRPGRAAVVSTQHPVMDWLRKGGSYFQTVLETDLWHTPGGDQPVNFWREPLSALCAAATGAGFLIEKLIEPVPADTMRDRYPEDYEQLSREPGFLILRLVKPATANPSPA